MRERTEQRIRMGILLSTSWPGCYKAVLAGQPPICFTRNDEKSNTLMIDLENKFPY